MSGSVLEDAALLVAIFEASVDAVLVFDQDRVITRANKGSYRLFGYGDNGLIGQMLDDLIPDAPDLLNGNDMIHRVAHGEGQVIDPGRRVDGVRRDGTIVPLHLSVGATDADGQPIFAAILHDLTQRIATEDALARSQRLDALGQMTGGVAHDFNNLLTIIVGNLELLKARCQDDADKAMVADALEAAEMGADLTERLTAFARRGDLKAEPFDLNAGCQTALSMLRRTLGEEHLIETEFAPDLPPVMVDPTQLQTAIVNLVLNARDAMPDGGTLIVRTERAEIDDTYVAQEIDVALGSYVRLSVTDNGIGMSPDAQLRAFEPFFTTKPAGRGTGLGLAMVYGFMRQTGGHVTLYSEANRGSTFALYFPIDGARQETRDGATRYAATGLPGGDQRVLVVDDNPQVLALSVERLRNLGYQTVQAPDGDTAFSMLRSGLKVDLLFSDIVMPGDLNGYQLARKVRATFPEIKILLTSGYAADTQDASPGFAVLQKPYRQLTLAKTLQAMLGSD